MTIKFMSTSNLAKADGIKSLTYGEAGSGKTHLISTAPRPVIFSAESGLLTLRKFNIPYQIIGTMVELVEAFNWSTKSAETRNFDTICLDSLSEIAEVILAKLKLTAKDPRQAYGETQDNILSMIRGFRDIPQKHIYFSAKQDRIKDEATGAMLYGPMMPGQKLAVMLPYFFDEFFQLQVFIDPATQKSYRGIRTVKDNQFQAKDRSGCLDPWEQPNLTEIFNKIAKG